MRAWQRRPSSSGDARAGQLEPLRDVLNARASGARFRTDLTCFQRLRVRVDPQPGTLRSASKRASTSLDDRAQDAVDLKILGRIDRSHSGRLEALRVGGGNDPADD